MRNFTPRRSDHPTVPAVHFVSGIHTDGWFAASALWQARLTPQETAAIALAALQATDAELAEMVGRVVLDGAGTPLPTFSEVMAEAALWTELATSDERAAYAVACFNRFSRIEKEEFREFVRGS